MTEEQTLALELARGVALTATNLSRVAKAVGDEHARWAFGQWNLRQRAASKFSRADEMLFDRDGLEMASHPKVAEYHASKYPIGTSVTEIGSGIGSDTIALASRGPVVSFELDSERLNLAEHNLGIFGLQADLRCENGLLHPATTIFADPTRRKGTQSRLSIRDLQPSPFELIRLFGSGYLMGIKLSPMTPDIDLIELTQGRKAVIEFLSFGRECREALVWVGTSVLEHGVFAVHVESGERLEESPTTQHVPMPMSYIYEADPAAIRAHVLGAFEMAALGESNGYLTSDSLVKSPWLRAYRVHYGGKGDVRETRSALRDLGGGTPIVKQRGAEVDPATLAKQLKLDGKRPLVVMVWKVGASIRHAIVENL